MQGKKKVNVNTEGRKEIKERRKSQTGYKKTVLELGEEKKKKWVRAGTGGCNVECAGMREDGVRYE